MSDIDIGVPAPEEQTANRAIGERPVTERFALYCSPEVHLDDLRMALNAAGFHLTAAPDGWYVDQVHAFALVRKDQSEEKSA